jgi:hypothetical protein
MAGNDLATLNLEAQTHLVVFSLVRLRNQPGVHDRTGELS